jgi:hypothetical protein
VDETTARILRSNYADLDKPYEPGRRPGVVEIAAYSAAQ